MALGAAIADALGPDVADEHPGVPGAERVIAPSSLEAVARAMRTVSVNGLRVMVWGGGTRQGIGHPVDPDVVLVTTRLDRVIDWQPEDLTIVVEAGMRVAALEELLATRRQTAVLPENPGDSTIGGVVATGSSGWRRLRYGPTRDRMLEVVLVTGDGRTVTGGGRVVKNVTGYDIPRLVTGSLGSLGVIGSVCLKLWPIPTHSGSIEVADAAAARSAAYRPLAVIETDTGSAVYVAGTEEEVAGQAADLGAAVRPDLHWPAPLDTPWLLSLRVPAAATGEAVELVRRLGGGVRFQAAHGVGEVTVGMSHLDVPAAAALRVWAEERSGALVVQRHPADAAPGFDPWGTPPGTLVVQRRIKAAFDPAGVANPGRLPGGI